MAAVASVPGQRGRTNWMDEAACRGHPDLFFAPRAERPPARVRREAHARRLSLGRAVPGVRPPQPGVRLLGRRVRGGAPPRRLHRAVADRCPVAPGGVLTGHRPRTALTGDRPRTAPDRPDRAEPTPSPRRADTVALCRLMMRFPLAQPTGRR
jgi:hypothetical protein